MFIVVIGGGGGGGGDFGDIYQSSFSEDKPNLKYSHSCQVGMELKLRFLHHRAISSPLSNLPFADI